MADNIDAAVNFRIEMIESLQAAVVKAGGRFIPYSELKNKTFEQLVRAFASNGIRFVCNKQVEKTEAPNMTASGSIPPGFVEEK